MAHTLKDGKITYLKLYTFLFLTFFSLFWGLYGWMSIPLFSYTVAGVGMLLVAAAFFILIVMRNDGRIVWNKESLLFLFLLSLTCIEIINTKRVAPTQSLTLTLIEAFPYISVCFEAFALSRLIRTKADLSWFMRTVEKASLLIACFSVIQFILYPNVIIFPQENEIYRNGLPRIYIGGGSILSAGMLFSVGNVFGKRRGDKLSWLNIILVLITMAVIRQARTNTAYLLFVFLLAFVYVSNIPKALRSVLYLCMVALLIFAYIYVDGSELIGAVIDSDMGIQARVHGIQFFIEKFLQYPLLGMGFITGSANADPVAYALLCSPTGYRYDRSDVGIIGVLNIFGIIGAIWYFLFLRRLWRNGKKLYRATGEIHGKVIFWYLTVTMINLIVMTLQMTMMIALVVVVTDKLCEFYAPDSKPNGTRLSA